MIGFSFPSLTAMLKTGTQLDFAYIDGSHRSDDTFLDAEIVWRMSKKKSLMLFDDYDWPTKSSKYPYNPTSLNDIEHPKQGIDAFLNIHRDELGVVQKKYQVCVKKSTNVRLGFPLAGDVTTVPLRPLLTLDNMMEEEETQLFDYIFKQVQEQRKSQNQGIYIFDFSR